MHSSFRREECDEVKFHKISLQKFPGEERFCKRVEILEVISRDFKSFQAFQEKEKQSWIATGEVGF
jgi:hypothetical protein